MKTENVLLDLGHQILKLADESNQEAKKMIGNNFPHLANLERAKSDAYTAIVLLLIEKTKEIQNV